MTGLIIVGAGPQQHQIGFRFVVSIEAKRVLDAGQDVAVGCRFGEQPSESIGLSGVRAANGIQIDDLPVDQLDAVVAGEDAGLGHFVISVDVEPMPCRRLGTLKNFAHGGSSSTCHLTIAGRQTPILLAQARIDGGKAKAY